MGRASNEGGGWRWALVVACSLVLMGAAGCRTAPVAEGLTPAGPALSDAMRTAAMRDDFAWTPTAAVYERRTPTTTSWVPAAAAPSAASGQGGGADDLAKQIQNPIADLISLPIQANLDQGYGPSDHAYRWTINVQPVIPIQLSCRWNVISRTVVPLVVREGVLAGEDDVFGIGDIVQSFFFSPRSSGSVTWGAGPVLLLPSATDDRLGAGQWGVGPTAVVLKQTGPWTYGVLANHIWSFAETGSRQAPPADPDVNATFVQPFLTYTFPSALSLSLNTEAAYDWEGDAWSVPINLGVSQVTKLGNQPVSLGLGFRYFAEAPEGGPEWGVRLSVTFLFPKK